MRLRWAGNVRRHVLITPIDPGACNHEPSTYGPSGAYEMRPWVRRVTLTLRFDDPVPREGMKALPRVVQLPYISSVRWHPEWGSDASPWRAAVRGERRQLLASFTGSLRGNPLSMRLRSALVRQCASVPSSVCKSHVSEEWKLSPPSEASATSRQEATLRRMLHLKRRSVFCLEPPGYSPPRKSIIDSLLSGCVPVLFYEPQLYESMMPHFFLPWGYNASVRLSASALLSGQLDVLQYLASLPEVRVLHMREVIAKHAHRLLYGLGEHGVPGDAIHQLVALLTQDVSDSGLASAVAATV